VLEDFETAPIDARLRAALRLLRKVTLEPGEVGPGDVRPVLAAGVTADGIVDMLHVGYLFGIYTRLAETMGWHVPDQSAFDASARRLLARGYLRD